MFSLTLICCVFYSFFIWYDFIFSCSFVHLVVRYQLNSFLKWDWKKQKKNPLFPLYRLGLVHILLCVEVEKSTRLLLSVHPVATFVTPPPALFCVVRLCLSVTVRKRRRNRQFLGHFHELASRYLRKEIDWTTNVSSLYTNLRWKCELCSSTVSYNGFLLPEQADWRSPAPFVCTFRCYSVFSCSCVLDFSLLFCFYGCGKSHILQLVVFTFV